jgi:hypothetical protein
MIEIVTPTPEQWRRAAYLQLKPYDADRAMEIEADASPVSIPLLGSVRFYSVEVVWKDDTWDRLYFGKDLHEAKTIIQSVAARHDLKIHRLAPKLSDIQGY